MTGRVYWLASEPDPRDVLGLGKRRRLPYRTYWRVVSRAEPFHGAGPARNVLLERVVLSTFYRWGEPIGQRWTPLSERMVRPFRGLRRV